MKRLTCALFSVIMFLPLTDAYAKKQTKTKKSYVAKKSYYYKKYRKKYRYIRKHPYKTNTLIDADKLKFKQMLKDLYE